ncbi:MAG TPA: L-aspartate oxidase [Verrucomicrobiota bacterium]|nr:L-aspartate oxidase [Verrucomicrobiales bacterium]HRI11794.1 L-aspartate oxidase [Verrucomicrobiota bacterium]
MPTPIQEFDFLVLGSGVAGLNFAYQVASRGRVAVITKKDKAASNTNWAQGGIASVTSREDSFELHIRDTLEAGAGLCREHVVRTIVEEGPARIQELLALGAQFTERDDPRHPGQRELDLTREGGHSKRRVLHAADATGAEIERTFLQAVASRPSIRVFEDHLAIDLITSTKVGAAGSARVLGVYVLDRTSGQVEVFSAPIVVLATGGSGKVYLYTTNPDIATGDGVAMAYRAGLPVANLEFVQFHPTCLFHPQVRNFLISEAVRGEGAFLRGADGQRFMERYDSRAELAPRDIVARAIDSEMKRTGADCVFLDLTHLAAEFIHGHFPTIQARCLELGIDITRQPIPVVPAAHYQCGGVVATVDGVTDLAGLYAIGEVACTGLHGANRLASNSLLEALVCSHRAAAHALASQVPSGTVAIPAWTTGSATDPDEMVVVSHNWDEVRRTMWDYVGIVRTTKRLRRAEKRLRNLTEEIGEFYWNFRVSPDLLELRNLVTVAELIVACALQRLESRGLHYNLDYARPDPAWVQRDTVVRRG